MVPDSHLGESHRTPAERAVDRLSAEARRLRQIPKPSIQQRNRLYEIEKNKLPAAWRVVNEMREVVR